MNIPLVHKLFDPLSLGDLELPNRIIMAPMSRLRSGPDGVPSPLMEEYYRQRATAGLIITESIAVAPYGAGYPNIPGLFTEAHIAAWTKIVSQVHLAGGRIAAQLWHVGRARREDDFQGDDPMWAVNNAVQPHELSRDDIFAIIEEFEVGARAASQAGFDAVEIHAGNGFLLDRMLRPSTNHREDDFGGSVENRFQLLIAIIAATQNVFPTSRIGIRLSPSATVAGSPDPEAQPIFTSLLDTLSSQGLAYVHVTRPTSDDRRFGSGPGLSFPYLRSHYRGVLIGAGEVHRDEAAMLISEGQVDAIAFGRLFLANPDLPRRFCLNAPLNAPNPDTYYTGGGSGLTDYPML